MKKTRHILPQNKKGPDHKFLPLDPDQAKAVDNSHSDHISFSFHFLNLNHDKFNTDSKTTHYFRKLIDRLKDISGIERSQLTGYSGKTLDFMQ